MPSTPVSSSAFPPSHPSRRDESGGQAAARRSLPPPGAAALLQTFAEVARGRDGGSVDLSGRSEREPFAEELDRLGDSGGAETEGALDDASLTADIACDVVG
jgi:hypothetical protein